jgi:hypothetical protein
VHGVLADAANTPAAANRETGTIEALAASHPADMANAADMGRAKAANTDATHMSTAEATHMSTAEAAASVPAPSATPRIGLRNRQARSQQGHR